MAIAPALSEFSKRRTLLTQRPPAIAPSPTQMPGPTTMQYIYPESYILSPQAVFTATNANTYRNKLNKIYFLNAVKITTLQTPLSMVLQNTVVLKYTPQVCKNQIVAACRLVTVLDMRPPTANNCPD